ncbi:sigma-70 family RNA polymerase sigma factor [Sorangium sp. So ce448]|uniref:RNA polymerase sigma factor n=1 Tax=Sorangium sp. So ce448 TaxID=3133314 RepID=UPI003F5E9026
MVLPSAALAPRLTLVRPSPLAGLDDAGLARAAAEGQPGAAGAVWDRYGAVVHGLLRRVLGPGGDVEDHAQETFLQFFREVKNLRDPAALRPFLLGIAVRVARSALRRRRLRRWFSLTDSGALPDEPAEGVDEGAREAVARLYALLDRLDDRARLLFVLRHIEGLELAETAQASGMSLATAKRHLAKVTARVHAMAERDPLLAAYVEPVEEASDG